MYDNKTTVIPTDVFYIAIDSRYRDIKKHPSAANYVIHLDTVFKNVISVELVHAIYDRPTGAAALKYVNLFIDELAANVTTNSDYMKGSFTQLPITENSMGRSLIYTGQLYKSIKNFSKPIAKLARMTIRFVGFDGSVFTIGEHYLRFEVTCMKGAGVPEWRNMDVVSNSANIFQNTTAVASPSLADPNEWNPRKVLGLTAQYTEDELKRAFVRKAKIYKNVDKMKYDESKRAFKELYVAFQ